MTGFAKTLDWNEHGIGACASFYSNLGSQDPKNNGIK